jgi:hypothetical protein
LKEPRSYFRQYAALSDEASERMAGDIWDKINGGADHTVDEVWLRKL